MERMTFEIAQRATANAAKAAGVSMTVTSFGTVGNGQRGYAITLSDSGRRLSPTIGTLRDCYEHAHVIINTLEAIKYGVPA